MRVIVMLKPTNKYGTKMEYSKFRKYLSQEGFLLVQSEVYIKTVSSRKSANRQITKMRHCVPTTGRVLVYKITENQFHSIQYLVGKPSNQGNIVGANGIVQI